MRTPKQRVLLVKSIQTSEMKHFELIPWNCLIKRADLAKDASGPTYGYSNSYTLPTDPFCLRVLEFSNGTSTYPFDNLTNNTGGSVFVIEGRKLLTDEDTAKIKFVARTEDPNEYDAGLVGTLSARACLFYSLCLDRIDNSSAAAKSLV